MYPILIKELVNTIENKHVEFPYSPFPPRTLLIGSDEDGYVVHFYTDNDGLTNVVKYERENPGVLELVNRSDSIDFNLNRELSKLIHAFAHASDYDFLKKSIVSNAISSLDVSDLLILEEANIVTRDPKISTILGEVSDPVFDVRLDLASIGTVVGTTVEYAGGMGIDQSRIDGVNTNIAAFIFKNHQDTENSLITGCMSEINRLRTYFPLVDRTSISDLIGDYIESVREYYNFDKNHKFNVKP